jgi:hypothetical protein
MFPRYNRPVDFGPKSDIHRCNVVSSTSIAARLTSEIISCRPVSLRGISTRRACSGCISRIYKGQRDVSNLSFVVRKHPEQSEIPSMQVTTLSLYNRNSVSNALKIFKRNRSQSVFGLRNKLLGDAMISIFGESGHPARELYKMAFSRFGAFALKSGFQRIEFVSGLANLLTRMHFSIAIYGQILNAKINTKNANRIIRRCFVYFNQNTKVEDSFDQNKVCLSSNAVEPGFLVFPKSDGDSLPTLERSQRDFLKPFPRKNPLVIDNSTIKPKLWFDRFVSLVCFADLGNGPDRQLGGKTEMFSDGIVDRLMDFNLVGTMQSKNCLCYVIARLAKPLHCLTKHLMLLWGGVEFYHQGLKHSAEDNLQRINSFWYVITASALLSRLKSRVSATPVPRGFHDDYP